MSDPDHDDVHNNLNFKIKFNCTNTYHDYGNVLQNEEEKKTFFLKQNVT